MTFPKRLKYFLIRTAAKLLIHAVMVTCRLKIDGAGKAAEFTSKGTPIIYVFWHRHIFVTIYRFKKSGARPLISLSEDGEIVSQVAEAFGMNPVRGSSSRGGARAFLALVNTVKCDKSQVLITADGPKGPPREIKDGTILLAQKTGSVIIPVSWYASREKVFEKTWDKFKIPLPFSRITYCYGEPCIVPSKAKRDDYCRYREALKRSIDSLEESVNGVMIKNMTV